jgi:hypothetical protein
MLRSAATFSRTEVHHEPPMKHPTIRNLTPTPAASAGQSTCLHSASFIGELATGIRLFEG